MGIDGDDKLFKIRNVFNATKLCTYKWLTKINIMLYIWYPNIKKNRSYRSHHKKIYSLQNVETISPGQQIIAK